ncbi:MAG: thioredoxin fold domain-containing protein [Chromatium okenii]|nr:thioredoxin fold domain-containing protein [Chromatium okenii]
MFVVSTYPEIFAVSTENFANTVLEASHQRPILVDFWADWCAPCRALSPQLERVIADLNGQIHLATLEVDEGDNMREAGRYQVRGFPTVMLFHYGLEIARFSGARSRHQIREWLQQQLGATLVFLHSTE